MAFVCIRWEQNS